MSKYQNHQSEETLKREAKRMRKQKWMTVAIVLLILATTLSVVLPLVLINK